MDRYIWWNTIVIHEIDRYIWRNTLDQVHLHSAPVFLLALSIEQMYRGITCIAYIHTGVLHVQCITLIHTGVLHQYILLYKMYYINTYWCITCITMILLF